MASNPPTPPESLSPDCEKTEQIEAAPNNLSLVEVFFDRYPDVNYVRLHWVDFSGILRTRIVPKSRFFKLAGGCSTYSVPQNCMIFPVSAAPECFPEGPERWDLTPDWSSLKLCGFWPRHAAVLCSVHQKGTEPRSPRCPRTLLKESLEKFTGKFSTEVLIGFEIEFVLLNQDSAIDKPFDRVSAYSTMAGLRGIYLTIIEETVEAMEAAGIKTYHFHAEAIDQLEIALEPLPPIEAIDALMYTQEALRTIALRHGLKATTSPKPVLNGPRNGCHMHISLNNSELADSFLAGILHKLRPLCAFGMPNWDSYARHGPDMAGTWVGYGTENRDLPIRKISESHWEIRIVDATANLYLFLAILLAAAFQAVDNKRELEWKDCTVFPADLAPEQLAKYCVQEKLPENFPDALKEAKNDTDIGEWIEEGLLRSYMKVKEKEVELFAKMADEERRQKFLVFF